MLFKPANNSKKIATHQQIGRAGSEGGSKRISGNRDDWWRNDPVLLWSRKMNSILFTGPRRPITDRPADHSELRMSIENCNLIGQFTGFPDVVGVDKCYEIAASISDAEIA